MSHKRKIYCSPNICIYCLFSLLLSLLFFTSLEYKHTLQCSHVLCTIREFSNDLIIKYLQKICAKFSYFNMTRLHIEHSRFCTFIRMRLLNEYQYIRAQVFGSACMSPQDQCLPMYVCMYLSVPLVSSAKSFNLHLHLPLYG